MIFFLIFEEFMEYTCGQIFAHKGKPAATESRYPTYCACWVYQCFRIPLNSDMDYRIFNVRTDVNAYDCTLGCADTRKRVFTES